MTTLESYSKVRKSRRRRISTHFRLSRRKNIPESTKEVEKTELYGIAPILEASSKCIIVRCYSLEGAQGLAQRTKWLIWGKQDSEENIQVVNVHDVTITNAKKYQVKALLSDGFSVLTQWQLEGGFVVYAKQGDTTLLDHGNSVFLPVIRRTVHVTQDTLNRLLTV